MAQTIKESFRQFSTNLNITDRQTSLVSTRRKNVVAALNEKLTLHPDQPSKLIGSYDRDTLIKYLSEGDIDVMVVLHYGQHKDWENKEGVTKSLNRFKDILKVYYPNIVCNIDRNCVTMRFPEFKLEVVPAFYYTTGDYKIPDTYRGAWLSTNPVKFADEVTRINKNMDGTFIPLIKMVKGWNRNFSKQLRGLHIECMMMEHYKNYTQSYTYDSTVNVFLSRLPEYLETNSYDPISGDRVDLYLDNASLGNYRSVYVYRAKKAAAAAQSAINSSAENSAGSIKQWKELLGDFFPAYG